MTRRHWDRARKNPRRARHRRRRNRFRPPPAPPQSGLHLPFDASWRSYYADPSLVRCGPIAACQMLSVHYGRTFDPEPIYERALELQPPGPATSPWANLEACRERGYITGMKWFNDIATARATLAQGLAFVVLTPNNGGAHIWCCTGIDDDLRLIYTPNDFGSPVDDAYTFELFESWMRNSWACCGVGMFA